MLSIIKILLNNKLRILMSLKLVMITLVIDSTTSINMKEGNDDKYIMCSGHKTSAIHIILVTKIAPKARSYHQIPVVCVCVFFYLK